MVCLHQSIICVGMIAYEGKIIEKKNEGLTTWLIGVPLGLLLSWGWKQPLPWVYFFLSLEEAVRLVIGYIRFRRGKWLKQLTYRSTEADFTA